MATKQKFKVAWERGQSQSPGHPSTTDEVWYSTKHILNNEQLSITSRLAFIWEDACNGNTTWTTARFQNDISRITVSISNRMLTSIWVRVRFGSGAVTIQMYVSNSMQISNNCFKLMQSLYVKHVKKAVPLKERQVLSHLNYDRYYIQEHSSNSN